MASMAATVAGAAKGPPRMVLTGAVRCMTAVMGNWRTTVTSGPNPMTTDSYRGWSSVNTRPTVQGSFVTVTGSWSTACGETSGATIVFTSITPTSSANALGGLCSGAAPHSQGPLCCIPDACPQGLGSVFLCAPLGWTEPQDYTLFSRVPEKEF